MMYMVCVDVDDGTDRVMVDSENPVMKVPHPRVYTSIKI
jgi:hypothetical protein